MLQRRLHLYFRLINIITIIHRFIAIIAAILRLHYSTVTHQTIHHRSIGGQAPLCKETLPNERGGLLEHVRVKRGHGSARMK